MTTKSLTGSYPSGYYLNPAYQSLDIEATASVGGAGVTTTSSQPSTINNLGKVHGTANGITLSSGGAITNGSSGNSSALIASVTNPIVANNGGATISNFAVVETDAVVGNHRYTYMGGGAYIRSGVYGYARTISLNGGGSVVNAASGQISNGISIVSGHGSLLNNGSIGEAETSTKYNYYGGAPPYFTHRIATTTEPGPSVDFQEGGTVTNGSSGNTAASLAGGIAISGGAGRVYNDGAIGGGTGTTYSLQQGYGGNLKDRASTNLAPSIVLQDGGSVTNGTNGNTAANLANGIQITGAAGTVINAGTIAGSGTTYSYTYHYWRGGLKTKASTAIGPSVDLENGGTVTNGNAAASLVNGIKIAGGLGAVVNAGTIGQPTTTYSYYLSYNKTRTQNTSTIGTAVELQDGGSVVNDGEIGTTAGVSYSIDIQGGGSLTNGTNGNTIASVGNGIKIAQGAGTVVNIGTIGAPETATHLSFGRSTTYGTSIVLAAGGTVTNDNASASIDHGITISGGPGSVSNTGTIGAASSDASYVTGIHRYSHYGSASRSISFADGGTVINGGGAITNGISITGGAATIVNDGTIGGPTDYSARFYYNRFTYRFFSVGYSLDLTAGSSVTNGGPTDTTANIANGIVISGGAGQIVNYATIGGPSTYLLPNRYYRPIHSFSPGIHVGAGSAVTNGSNTDTVARITNGILIDGAGSVLNFGTIDATAAHRTGVDLGSGTITNGSASDSTAVIAGDLVGLGLSSGTVVNWGTIQAARGSALVFNSSSCTLVEEGTGSLGGSRVKGGGGTLELAADGGVGTLTGLGTRIESFGTVVVDVGASWAFTGANVLLGPLRNDGSLTNLGTFTNRSVLTNNATLTNDGMFVNFGTITGSFVGTAQGTLVEEAGGTVNGTVQGGSGKLELGNKAGPGTLTGLGSTIMGFSLVQIDRNTSWSLESSTIGVGATLKNNGALTLLAQVTNNGSIDNQVGSKLLFEGDVSITTGPAVKAGAFTNAGLVEKLSGTGTSIIRTGKAGLTDAGTIDVETGILELTGSTISITGVIKGAGTIEFSTGAATLGAGSSVSSAGFTIAGSGADLTVARVLSYAGSFSAGANTELTIASADLLQLSGTASFYHDTIDGAGQVRTAGTTTVNQVTLGGTAQWYNTGTLNLTGGMLTVGDGAGNVATFNNQAAGVFDLAGNTNIGVGTAVSIFKNQGLLAKTAGGLSKIAIALTNTGTVEAASGTLDLQGAVSGKGTLRIDAGKVLQADAAVSQSQTVDFNGGGDKLLLTDAGYFAGRLQGFGAADKLDLRQFDPTTSTLAFFENGTNTAGVLVATDGALQAKITLLGQYAASAFHKISDGLGGTLVTYSPLAASALAPPHS
jgi:hypothetical protein